MSVQINCDRCGANTKHYFLNAKVEVIRGSYASVNSKVSPAQRGLPWKLDWHLCESCVSELRRWAEPPPQQARSAA